jgi:signal transduction histidine kinase
MKLIIRKNSIEKYAQIGKISHELFHDLLNPITGLMLHLEILDKNINKVDIANHIEEVKDSSKRVRNFIKLIQNNLLNPDQKEFINLDQEINEIIKLTYSKARKNNVSIVFIGNKNQKIFMSKLSFYQLLINLISNSIDSFETINDDRKRKIIIKAEKISAFFKISVTDNGCGIKTTKGIFKLGYSNKNDGFGIGLKTVQKIIKNNKGKISVKSLGENKGTEFKILLPKNH